MIFLYSNHLLIYNLIRRDIIKLLNKNITIIRICNNSLLIIKHIIIISCIIWPYKCPVVCGESHAG